MRYETMNKFNCLDKLDLHLKPTRKAILDMLVRLANNYISYPSQVYIAEKLNVCRATVNRHVKALEALGLITIVKSKTPEQQYANNTYFLNFFFDALKNESASVKEQLDGAYEHYFNQFMAETPGHYTDVYDRELMHEETVCEVIENLKEKTGLKTISVLNVILNVSEQVKTSYIANLRGYLEKSFRNAMAEQGLRERLLSMGDLFFDEREDIMIAAALDKQ